MSKVLFSFVYIWLPINVFSYVCLSLLFISSFSVIFVLLFVLESNEEWSGGEGTEEEEGKDMGEKRRQGNRSDAFWEEEEELSKENRRKRKEKIQDKTIE